MLVYLNERPLIADSLAFVQESANETGKYQCDCDLVAGNSRMKVVQFGNVAAHDDWGCIEIDDIAIDAIFNLLTYEDIEGNIRINVPCKRCRVPRAALPLYLIQRDEDVELYLGKPNVADDEEQTINTDDCVYITSASLYY